MSTEELNRIAAKMLAVYGLPPTAELVFKPEDLIEWNAQYKERLRKQAEAVITTGFHISHVI